ncbi:hypothetical protein TNIN_280241 [Trichonephila inaurata madagascariensis]|uniref:Uncharacterized protein n=1 Tax=Trichonephila inaurata madagascariensis TaxID=2747483 RepID=A0A8X6XF29_9ARAC|nr:hypothetical protein TNIN_280241 [Trichonephila inaurata madagascariensis]
MDHLDRERFRSTSDASHGQGRHSSTPFPSLSALTQFLFRLRMILRGQRKFARRLSQAHDLPSDSTKACTKIHFVTSRDTLCDYTECFFFTLQSLHFTSSLSHDGSVFVRSPEKRRFVKDRGDAIKDGHVVGGAVVIVRQRASPPLENFILSYCFISEDLPPEWIEYGFYSKWTGRNPVFHDMLMFPWILVTPGGI